MKKFPVAALIFLIALVLLGLYFFGWPSSGASPAARVIIGGREFKVDIAENALDQARGLSGRPSLGEDEGMLFVFSTSSGRSFWMKDMNFPIDIVWIDKGRIIGAAESVMPEPDKNIFGLKTYSSPGPADTVLEISAGLYGRYGFKPGDPVEVMR